MSFKTITIKEAVYKELLLAKGKEESFSELLGKLVKEKKKKSDLSKFYGAWKISDTEWKKIEATLIKRKKGADKNYRGRLERIFG